MKSYHLLLPLLVFVVLAGCGFQGKDDVARGLMLQNSGDLAGAKRAFQAALEKCSDKSKPELVAGYMYARIGLGSICLREMAFTDGLQHFEAAVAAHRSHRDRASREAQMVGVQALCNLVTFHLYVGDFPTAEALLKEAREDLLTRIKDPTRLRMQERTLLYFTRAGVSAREGVLHRVRGEFGPALECFAAAAADGELSLSGPGFAQDATRQTGLTLALQKRRNQSSGGKPSDPIVDGLFYLRTGDFPKAADSYRAALQQNTEPRNWSLEGGLGLALHRAQEVDEATKHLSEARSYIAMIRANLPEKFRVSFEDASWNGIGVHEVLEVATSY